MSSSFHSSLKLNNTRIENSQEGECSVSGANWFLKIRLEINWSLNWVINIGLSYLETLVSNDTVYPLGCLGLHSFCCVRSNQKFTLN